MNKQKIDKKLIEIYYSKNKKEKNIPITDCPLGIECNFTTLNKRYTILENNNNKVITAFSGVYLLTFTLQENSNYQLTKIS